MTNLKRVYFHYEDLEEWRGGMWRIVRGEERLRYRDLATALMRDTEAFKDALEALTLVWPNSCLAALTTEGANRIAWLGQGACCLEVGSPEECTRLGWHALTLREQHEANRVAGDVLARWDKEHAEDTQLMLFGGSYA